MIAFFEKIVDALNTQNIPYMLSGSMAMSTYVSPRATRDFDFIIHLKPEGVNSFANNFQDGFYCDRDSIKEAVEGQNMFNIIDHASGFKSDFVVLKNHPFRQEEFNRRIKIDFFGRSIFIVTPEDLLISKLIWIQDLQSALQIEDIKNLSAVKNLDWSYIKGWVHKLNLNTFALIPYD
jgi:hypothetical protein